MAASMATAMLLAACSGIGGSPPPAALPPGLLATFSDGADLILWTQAGNALTGSLSIATAVIGQAQLQHETDAFSGVRNGDSVTLSFASVNWNGSSTLTGQFQDGSLTLAFPRSDGTISNVVFAPGTPDDYNRAITTVSSSFASLATCGLPVQGANAFVLVAGADGSLAWSSCTGIAAQVAVPSGSWGTPIAPDARAPASDSLVCYGMYQNTPDSPIAVYDSGTQFYGHAICNALGL